MEVTYVNHYLTDRDVANFARQSFNQNADNYTAEQNNNLIRFLARGMSNKDWEETNRHLVEDVDDQIEMHHQLVKIRSTPEHWVPFGHPHITLNASAPVPIARQSYKHKIGFVESEESRRYIKYTPNIFFPEFFREAAANVKQGSAGVHPDNLYWMDAYKRQCESALALYNEAIEDGVCPEQARFILPQGTEVKWTWTGSLYAYANFYKQRSDPHAQKEIQDLAEQVGKIIAPLYPVSWSALTKGHY